MNRILFHVFAPLAVAVAAVCPAKEAGIATVSDKAGMDALIHESVMQGKAGFTFRLGDDAGQTARLLLKHSFWFDYAKAYRYTSDGSVYRVSLTLKDSTRMLLGHRDSEYRKKLDKRERAALGCLEERLAKLITPGMSDGEKVRAIHDDLVNRVTYNRRSGGECSTIILTDSGLCDAYSRYMYLALNIIGIECHAVLGWAGEPHAWNLVKINGHWYHIDATWDDPISSVPMLRHDYFCISDKAIARSHKWNVQTYPAAPAMNSAYFKRQHRYFTQYEAFWRAVRAAYEAGEGTFEAKLTPLEKEDRFAGNLKAFTKKNPDVRVEHFTHSVTDPTIIFLTFAPKEDHRKKVEPTERKDTRPKDTGKGAMDWLDPDMWKDLCTDFDSDKLLQEGRQLLDDAGKKGKELLDQGADKGKELMDDGAGQLKRLREGAGSLWK